MIDGAITLTDETLLEIIRVSADHKELTPELFADLRAARSLVGQRQSCHDTRLEHGLALLTSALGRLSPHNLRHYPFGHSGPTIQSDGWVDRDTVEKVAHQIAGLMWSDALAARVAIDIQHGLTQALTLSFIEQVDYDAWQPGMASGSGWRAALSATPYGVTKARALVQANMSVAQVPTARVNPVSAAPPVADRGCYIYLSSGLSPTPDSLNSLTVIYRAQSRTLAESLRRMFISEYPNEVWQFVLRQVDEVDLDLQVLLDEAIEQLANDDDPDSGLYHPRPSREVIARAQYAIRASKWEAMLLQKIGWGDQTATETARADTGQNRETGERGASLDGGEKPNNDAQTNEGAAPVGPQPATNADRSASDRYEWARQVDLVRATNQVLGQGVLDPGVLSRACKDGLIDTNGKSGRAARVKVNSFVSWVGRKCEIDTEEQQQVRSTIIAILLPRNS